MVVYFGTVFAVNNYGFKLKCLATKPIRFEKGPGYIT